MVARPLAPALALLSLVLAGCLGGAPPVEPTVLPPVLPLAIACPVPCKTAIDTVSPRSFEPTVAVNPLDPLHLVAASVVIEGTPSVSPARLLSFWSLVHLSRDGGLTWETSRIPGGPSAGPSHPLFTATTVGDPVVAFLPDGAVLFSGLAMTMAAVAPSPAQVRSGYSLFVLRSEDGGATWGEPSFVARGEGVLAFVPGTPAQAAALWDAHDKQWMAVAPDGRVLMAWTEILAANPEKEPANRCDIVAALSADGGLTWGAPVQVQRAEPGQCLGGAAPAARADGGFAVAYFSYANRELFVATSADGAAWEATKVGSASFMPTLKAAPHEGGERLHLAFPLTAQPEGAEVPALMWSDDGGRTWTEPLLLDGAEAPGGVRVAMDAGPDGTVWVAWFHAKGEQGEAPEYRALAVRGGEVAPFVVLDASVGSAAALVGDYVGLAAFPDGSGAYTAWVARPGDSYDVFGAALRQG